LFLGGARLKRIGRTKSELQEVQDCAVHYRRLPLLAVHWIRLKNDLPFGIKSMPFQMRFALLAHGTAIGREPVTIAALVETDTRPCGTPP
jgi:hypothetical protein